MGEEEAGRIRVRKLPEERGLNSHRRLPLLQTSVMPGQVFRERGNPAKGTEIRISVSRQQKKGEVVRGAL